MENPRLEAEVTNISDKGLVTVQVTDTEELKRQAAVEEEVEGSMLIREGKLLFPAVNLDSDTSIHDLTVGTRVSLRLSVDGGRARANEVKKID